MSVDDLVNEGLYVNVDGVAGEVTQDPVTGENIIAVNTHSLPPNVNTPISNQTQVSGTTELLLVIGAFVLALFAFGKRRA